MRRCCKLAAMVMALVACAVTAADGQDQKDKDKEKDKDKVNIEGVWKVTNVNFRGKDQADFKEKNITLTFLKDGKLTSSDGGKVEEGKYKIDIAKTPMEIDLAKGASPKDDAKGIFAVDGDTLKIAIAVPGEPTPKRPASFDETTLIVLTLKKQAK